METYKIIGGDGREYGPASLLELKSWITEGRVGRDTLVWNSESGVWLPASRLAEIQGELRQLHGDAIHAPTLRKVGFFPRLGAYFVDQIILGGILMLLLPIATKFFGLEPIPLMTEFGSVEEMLKQMEKMSSAIWPLILPLHFLYYFVFNGTFGATPGKMLIGARIVRLDGSPIGYGTALFRWCGERLSDFACYIGYLFIAFRPDRRGLHDLLAGTQVIYKR